MYECIYYLCVDMVSVAETVRWPLLRALTALTDRWWLLTVCA